jgi:FkbM family methyltransferase
MKTSFKIKIAKLIYSTLMFFKVKKNISVKRKSIKWTLDLAEGIDLSIFIFGSFQSELSNSITNLINKKKNQNIFFNIIDVGSNIGDKSLSIAKNLLNKNIKNFKIFSIEPTDYAFQKQKKNLNNNPQLKKKISISKFYVSNKKIKPKKIYSSWRLDNKKDTHKVHFGSLNEINSFTKTISLDNFIKKKKIKNQIIIKIDVDGFELDVLKSCKNFLKKNDTIIFMEYAPYALKEYGSSIKEFTNFLQQLDYKIYDLQFNRLKKISILDGSSIDIVLMKNNLD